MYREIIEESNASSIRAPHMSIHILAIEKKYSALSLHFASSNLETEWNVLRFVWYIDNINAFYFIISNNIYKTYKSHT